jgi:hypothetical protein
MRGREPKRRRGLLIVSIAVLVALVVCWAVGRVGSGSGPSSSAQETATTPGAINEEARAGIQVGFPDTAHGAAAAVATYQRAFASPSILRPSVMRERIEAVATPDYAAQMLAANGPGRERLAAGPIGVGIGDGLQTLYSSVPIGYEVEAFSPARARILTWGFTLLGNSSAVEPEAYFGLTHTELRWVEGTWRIAATSAGFGPTPRLATNPGPLGAYDVVGLAAKLTSYVPGA